MSSWAQHSPDRKRPHDYSDDQERRTKRPRHVPEQGESNRPHKATLAPAAIDMTQVGELPIRRLPAELRAHDVVARDFDNTGDPRPSPRGPLTIQHDKGFLVQQATG